MAFHVACPITCKRICFCGLGFSRCNVRNSDLLSDFSRIEEFLKDPWIIRVKEGATIQVPVPKVVPPPPPVTVSAVSDGDAAAAAEELLSAQTKRVALQKKAAVASMAAEDFARRFESGALVEATKDSGIEEQGSSNVKVMCRLCFSGEYEGSERSKRMLPCSSCGKKYHRDCLKSWSQHRDLFHWSSWTCPSCRTCEVCRRTGEPNKFKFCKRCDGAFHCYCMQPPHKNVSSGPYLCPKHTKCHSCGSNVPGNGLSVRWFLGYTCCDACGRLFTKGNYCPACLKVYRDSEATPMVCCDICQRWVHCGCDGISDERYLQFQIDGNLPYTCPTCRGECCPVNRLEDAVHELWRRKDEADRDLIASLRAAAGLPTQEDIFSISPFSDNEDNDVSARKVEHGRARFSLKNVEDFSPKKIKESGKKPSSKKHVKKKGNPIHLGGKMEVKPEEYYGTQSFGSGLADKKKASQPHPAMFSSPVPGSFTPIDRTSLNNEHRVVNHKSMDEVGNNDRRATVLQIKSKTNNDTGVSEDVAQVASKPKTVKGTKLVIHLGGRNKTITNSPRSDSSSYQREQELTTLSGGNEAVSQDRVLDKQTEKLDGTSNSDDGYKVDGVHEVKGGKLRDRNIIKLGKGKFGPSGPQSHIGNGSFGQSIHIMSSRKSEANAATEGLQNNLAKSEKVSLRKHPDNRLGLSGDSNKLNQPATPASDASLKDSRPLLRLKFKTPYPGSWIPQSEEERGSVKGQRSKRKRPSSVVEKPAHKEQKDFTETQDENLMNEIMDANWILKKLGKDAIGKRVEVHQSPENSWHKGVVSNVIEGTSLLSVDLDDGRAKTVELGKQGVRFVPQKQKKLKS